MIFLHSQPELSNKNLKINPHFVKILIQHCNSRLFGQKLASKVTYSPQLFGNCQFIHTVYILMKHVFLTKDITSNKSISSSIGIYNVLLINGYNRVFCHFTIYNNIKSFIQLMFKSWMLLFSSYIALNSLISFFTLLACQSFSRPYQDFQTWIKFLFKFNLLNSKQIFYLRNIYPCMYIWNYDMSDTQYKRQEIDLSVKI